MKSKLILAASFLIVTACSFAFARTVSAESSFFTANCASCHSDDRATCNGCHAHGIWQNSSRTTKNLHATTDLLNYQPGQTVTVTFSGGYRQGWVRAILKDQNGVEIDRVTGPTGTGDDGSGSPDLQFPVTLSAPAPSTPGFYTWSASWFGSPFDENNSTAFPHVTETVSTNQFEVYVVPTCQDADGDGYEDSACNADPTDGGGDCDDTDASVNPGMTEIPYNGIDDDCEASTPDDDLDNDGYAKAFDCDDNNPDINPNAAEVCDDGIDNDCDGLVDGDDPDCEGPLPVDADGDGYVADADCDDNDPAVNPGAAEVCDDGIDNDCDGLVDGDDPDCGIQPPSEIHLRKPKDGARLKKLSKFKWSSKSADTFRVEFSHDPDFSTILWTSPRLETKSFTPQSVIWNKAAENAPIYWRVRGAEKDATPVVVQTSQEAWSFIKIQPHDDDDDTHEEDDRDDHDDDDEHEVRQDKWRKR